MIDRTNALAVNGYMFYEYYEGCICDYGNFAFFKGLDIIYAQNSIYFKN